MGTAEQTMARLDDQIDWYDRSSAACQHRYKLLKGIQLFAAAALPVTAPFGVHAAVPAAIGALIIVVEGFQQLNQYEQCWTSYRSTCEALKHEKYRYLARAGPYLDVLNPTAALADRIEAVIAQEHARWVSVREDANASAPTTPSTG